MVTWVEKARLATYLQTLAFKEKKRTQQLMRERLKRGWFHEPCFVKYAKGHRVLLAQSEYKSVWLVLS